jgi:transposase
VDGISGSVGGAASNTESPSSFPRSGASIGPSRSTQSPWTPPATSWAPRRFAVNAGPLRALLAWAAGWPRRQFAVEGAHGLGRGIAQQLTATGEHVLDVPATLAARVRLLSTGGGRKTDTYDAHAVAQVALHQQGRLRVVAAEDQTVILRLLSERRDDLTAERTRLLNRLHQLLRELIPGGADLHLTGDKAAALLRVVRPATATDAYRRDLAKELLADLRRLDRRLTDNEAELRDAVAATDTGLPEIHGLGLITTAKILGIVSDITRFQDPKSVA